MFVLAEYMIGRVLKITAASSIGWHYGPQSASLYYCRTSVPYRRLRVSPSHYQNTPIQIYRQFHLRKLEVFR